MIKPKLLHFTRGLLQTDTCWAAIVASSIAQRAPVHTGELRDTF